MRKTKLIIMLVLLAKTFLSIAQTEQIQNGAFELDLTPSWMTQTECHCGNNGNSVSIFADNGSNVAKLSQSWMPNNYARLWQKLSSPTSKDTAWKVSASINFFRGTWNNAVWKFGLGSSTTFSETPDLYFTVTPGVSVTCSFRNGATYSTRTVSYSNSNFSAYETVSLEYQPKTGYYQLMFGNNVVLEGQTNKGIAMYSIQFENANIGSNYSPADLFIDNISLKSLTTPSATFCANMPSGSWSSDANCGCSDAVNYVKTETLDNISVVKLHKQWGGDGGKHAAITYKTTYPTATDKVWTLTTKFQIIEPTASPNSYIDLLIQDSNLASLFKLRVSRDSLLSYVFPYNGTKFEKGSVGIFDNGSHTLTLEYNPQTGYNKLQLDTVILFQGRITSNISFQSLVIENGFDGPAYVNSDLIINDLRLVESPILNPNTSGSHFSNKSWTTDAATSWNNNNPINPVSYVNTEIENNDTITKLHQVHYDRVINNKHVCYASTWHTHQTPFTSANNEWELSVNTKLERAASRADSLNKRAMSKIALYDSYYQAHPLESNVPSFEIKVKNFIDGCAFDTVCWKTPTAHGTIRFNHGLEEEFQKINFRYNPNNGYVKLSIGIKKLYEGFTIQNVSLKTLLASTSGNTISPEVYSTSSMLIKNITVRDIPINEQTPSLLHSIPEGDFNNGLVANVTGGTWTTFNGNNPIANCNISCVDGVMDLFQNYYPQSAAHTFAAVLTYTDNSTSPPNKPWKISADLKRVDQTGAASDVFELIDSVGAVQFSMNFIGLSGSNNGFIKWKAGNQSDSVTLSATLSRNFFKKASITYNPIDGSATGRLGTDKIFETKTQNGLKIKQVRFQNSSPDKYHWDPSHLYVDNVKIEAISDLSKTGILSGIPEGDFNTHNTDVITKVLSMGYWQGYSSDSTFIIAFAKIVNDSPSQNHAELTQKEAGHWAGLDYTNYVYSTPKNQMWRVSLDMKGRDFQNFLHNDNILLTLNAKTIFQVSFKGKKTSASKSEIKISIDGQEYILNNVGQLENYYQKVILEYNPTNGLFIFKIDEKEKFRIITSLNLVANKLQVSNYCDPGIPADPGTLCIDNIKAEAIQNEKIQYRGIATRDLSYNNLEFLKQTYGINHVRYFMAPIWSLEYRKTHTLMNNPRTLSQDSACNCGDFHNPNLCIDWNMHKMLNELEQNLDNAKRLGIAVTVNVHQNYNDSDMPHYSGRYWESSIKKNEFLSLWDTISTISGKLNNNISLELYNEPIQWEQRKNKDGKFEIVEKLVNGQPVNDTLQNAKMPKRWPEWAQAAIDTIRENDKIHQVMVASGPGAIDNAFAEEFKPLHDPYKEIIYVLHQWEPTEYTLRMDTVSTGVTYNDTIKNIYNPKEYFNKNTIRNAVKESRQFQQLYGVEMYVSEFGAIPHPKVNQKDFIRESAEVWNEYGWHWSYWSQEGPFGIVPNDTILKELYSVNGKQAWNQTVILPAPAPSPSSSVTPSPLIAGNISEEATIDANNTVGQDYSISAYPNPIHNNCVFSISGASCLTDKVVTIEIRDVLGLVVDRLPSIITNSVQWQIPNHLNNGLYLVLLYVDGQMVKTSRVSILAE